MTGRQDAPRQAALYDSGHAMHPLQALRGEIAAAVEAGLAGTGVSMGMRAVLEVVYRNGPMSVAEMAGRLKLAPALVQRATGEAAAAGLLEPLPNPAHRNAHFLQITKQGRAAVQLIRDREARYLGVSLQRAPQAGLENRARIRRALDLFYAGIGAEREIARER